MLDTNSCVVQAVVHSLSELARVLHADSLITNSLSADPGLIRKGMNPTEVNAIMCLSSCKILTGLPILCLG